MMHATAVEVLLYLTPAHCSAMLASLAEGMNRQYARFRLRHPDFQASARACALCTACHASIACWSSAIGSAKWSCQT